MVCVVAGSQCLVAGFFDVAVGDERQVLVGVAGSGERVAEERYSLSHRLAETR